MAISGDYSAPVMVNGYSCKNCTEVDEAKKHIDPAHPKDGPYGIDKKDQLDANHGSAVKFGGALAGVADPSTFQSSQNSGLSARVDISV